MLTLHSCVIVNGNNDVGANTFLKQKIQLSSVNHIIGIARIESCKICVTEFPCDSFP